MDIHTKFVHLQLNVKGSWFLLAKWISLETQMYKGKIDTFSIILFASKPPSKGTFSRCLAVSCLCAHTRTFYICPWHTTPTSNTWWDFQDRSLRDWGTWSKMTWVKSRYDRNDFCFLFDRFVILGKNRKKKRENVTLRLGGLLCNSSLWRSLRIQNQSSTNSMYANNTSLKKLLLFRSTLEKHLHLHWKDEQSVSFAQPQLKRYS